MKQSILRYDALFEEQAVGGYTVTVPALPGCISEGNTFEDAKRNIAEAITAYLESLALDGNEIPNPEENVFIGKVTVANPIN